MYIIMLPVIVVEDKNCVFTVIWFTTVCFWMKLMAARTVYVKILLLSLTVNVKTVFFIVKGVLPGADSVLRSCLES